MKAGLEFPVQATRTSSAHLPNNLESLDLLRLEYPLVQFSDQRAGAISKGERQVWAAFSESNAAS
jgi:hypothetical protein